MKKPLAPVNQYDMTLEEMGNTYGISRRDTRKTSLICGLFFKESYPDKPLGTIINNCDTMVMKQKKGERFSDTYNRLLRKDKIY